MPADSHPMTMFSAAILSMNKDSLFVKKYHEGVKKAVYWEYYYEDAMNLLAKLPEIAAFIYRLKYRNGDIIPPDPKLDFGANFAHMMGISKPYDEVARMYFILHSDHESGNVSAHTGHLVASALSDIFYAISAMLNGLAGPLHGLANEEVLRWLHGVMEKMGGKVPTEEEMKPALKLIRQAQWRWDWVAAANGVGFHAPVEALRVLGNSIQKAEQARKEIALVLVKHNVKYPVALPDYSTKEKAQKLIGLKMDELIADKKEFLKTTAIEWDKKAEQRQEIGRAHV